MFIHFNILFGTIAIYCTGNFIKVLSTSYQLNQEFIGKSPLQSCNGNKLHHKIIELRARAENKFLTLS